MTNTVEYEVIWNDITILITHACKWYSGNFDHIEIRSIVPEKAQLPITETGYKSHFVHEEAVAEYSDAKAYVLAWLDHEASSKKWMDYVAARQQLLLF